MFWPGRLLLTVKDCHHFLAGEDVRTCKVVALLKTYKEKYLSSYIIKLAMQSFLISLLPFASVHAMMGGEGLMWSVLQNQPLQLTVCWENPSAAEPLPLEADQTGGWQRREWVRLALKRTWEREARISFDGWQECQNEENAATPPNSYGPRRPGTADENIKIQISNTGGGQNPAHGSWGDYQRSGLILNLHSLAGKDDIEFLAIHEFGHALGLYHGEERNDWPATTFSGCPPQTYIGAIPPWWPVPIEKRWGIPDNESVMAYCSPRPNFLSPRDVAGIQRAYERHISGTLLSLPGSLCLSAHASAGNGESAFGWACDEALDDQEWHYDASNSSLYIQSPRDPAHTRHCLDVDTTNYSDVQIWDCLNGTNQQWQFQRIMIRGYGGLCLSRQTGSGGDLTMQTCEKTDDQLWRVEKGDTDGYVRLRSNTGNQCLALGGESGSVAELQPCSSSKIFVPIAFESRDLKKRKAVVALVEGQPPTGVLEFYLAKSGQILAPRSGSSNLCLDVRDVWDNDFISGLGGPETGQVVQFFNCYSTQLNQKWGFSGHLVSEDRCLTLSGTAVNNGASATMTECGTANQQNWDYYW